MPEAGGWVREGRERCIQLLQQYSDTNNHVTQTQEVTVHMLKTARMTRALELFIIIDQTK